MNSQTIRVRICAGMAFGLLAGNVFLVHTASNSNLGSLKMVEVKREKKIKKDKKVEILIHS